MPLDKEGIDFEAIFVHERDRLVGLCARLSGNREVAEDLAQETLMAAWRNRGQLTSLDKLKPWTSAIARHICLNWSRGYFREQAHTHFAIDSETDYFDDDLEAETDLELELDRVELAKLLDQALSLLPPESARMLVEHYVHESSQAEIAEKMNVRPGTVAVRLQRGKLTLKKVLQKNLQAQSSAFGFIDPKNCQWEETNIWCPGCGQVHLLGKYQKEQVFALRCPKCDLDPEAIMAGLDLSKPYHAALLGNVKTYKPAYSRLLTGFAPLFRQALNSHTAPCFACGSRLLVVIEHGKRTCTPSREFTQIILHCPACDWAASKSLSGLVMTLPQAQRFWREHPRMRTLPVRDVEAQGISAFLSQFESLTDNSHLTIISRRDTFEPIQVHANVKL